MEIWNLSSTLIHQFDDMKCTECNKKAKKVVDGTYYCSKCCDTLLIGIIGKCMKHIKYADVKMSILPKRGKTIKGV